jgi:hypothetical protein
MGDGLLNEKITSLHIYNNINGKNFIRDIRGELDSTVCLDGFPSFAGN